jgi:hypothetical protein
MLLKWLPWNYILKRAARRFGFIDPVMLLARLRGFGRPSEIQEPIELLRAGVVFHARGLINTRAMQYNLDWVWPYWVVKQFTPRDASFIPRGFAFSHVNLSHRNWTAVGHPDLPLYPIVDPRGLVTPLFDGWSIDFWVLSETGKLLLPSHQEKVEQTLDLSPVIRVNTISGNGDLSLHTAAWVAVENQRADLVIRAQGETAMGGGWLIMSLRPYNPEGIQFIDHINFNRKPNAFRLNHQYTVNVGESPDKVLFSNYRKGDVAQDLNREASQMHVDCPIGMATAAAFFELKAGQSRQLDLTVALEQEPSIEFVSRPVQLSGSDNSSPETACLHIPDVKFTFLYNAAVQTLLMLTATEAFPGPYTYRRFWFRDACFIINALLALGLSKRSWRLIQAFPERQTLTGYFKSQEGEWDSNGQVLWIAERFHRLTGQLFDAAFLKSLMKAAKWIHNKRRRKGDGKRHDGLLPAGFSAEHLGPNDYYYWDNFWSLAGLKAAARIARKFQLNGTPEKIDDQVREYEARIFSSIPEKCGRSNHSVIPASPYRRMDAGAIGSLVADYPLQLTSPGDTRIMNTVSYLMTRCFQRNAFFQDMIHSGINIYLTLDIAQTLLRSNDSRYRQLINTVAELASPTGQWPEAINPLTGGGCMGDGQHGWASAEWIMMMRNLFVREEGNTLIIGSGIFPQWLEQDGEISFGPTLVPGGKLTVRIQKCGNESRLYITSDIRGEPLSCLIEVPGYEKKKIDTSCEKSRLKKI